MGWALVRGWIAFLAMYATFIVVSVVTSFLYAGTTACPEGLCSIGDYATQALSLVIVYAYSFGLLSWVLFIPYMILFLALSYLNAMFAVLWVVIGAVLAVWLSLSQHAFGDGVGQGGGWPVLASVVASRAGLIAILIGGSCGYAVWATDRRLKAM